MSKKTEPTEQAASTEDVEVFKSPYLDMTVAEDIPNPVLNRRQAYSINRVRIIDTSLDEGEKLHGQGCIKRGISPEHFVFRAPNGIKTRHDLYIRLETHNPQTIWDVLLCSCPTGRHAGDPCWHKGAVRAFLADNEHIRHANRLLALSLT